MFSVLSHRKMRVNSTSILCDKTIEQSCLTVLKRVHEIINIYDALRNKRNLPLKCFNYIMLLACGRAIVLFTCSTCYCFIYMCPYDTYIGTVMSLLLMCCVVYWRHIDIMAATLLNHRPRDAHQPTLGHRDIVIVVTVTVWIW